MIDKNKGEKADLKTPLDSLANPIKGFVPSIFDLVEHFLDKNELTDEQRGMVARLRSYIDINFKNF